MTKPAALPYLALALAAACAAPLARADGAVSRVDVDTWLAAATVADAPRAGEVIDNDALHRVRPYLPPGYADEFAWPGVALEIQATADYPGDPVYVAATARFAGEARLGAGGELESYTAGRPFSDAQIAAASPAQAGFMVGWNQIHRWQFTGYKVDELSMTYLSPSGTGEDPRAEYGLEGGGTVQRRLTQKFHRVYLSHLAWMADNDYRMDVADADERLYKDYIEFLSPFNVAGTKFVVERSLDPHEDDQVNTYLPTERRVRRFSAKERADSFMGSDVTLDDFDGFAGRVLDYRWTYLGSKTVLDVIDAGEPLLRFGGPASRAIIDRWQLRDCHVVELHSTWDGHPYGSRLLFIDKQTYDVAVALAFDHQGRLWKVFDPVYRATRGSGPDGAGTVSSWRGQANIDLVGGTATVVHAMSETEHPPMKAAQVRRIFSVSSLTAGQ